MTNGFIIAGALVLSLAAQDPGAPGASSNAAGQRAPARDRENGPPAVPRGTGSIAGRVLSGDGVPLRRTQVRLSGNDGARTTLSDGNGGYSFADLPSGLYTVRADLEGYVGLAYGQRAPNEPPRSIAVGDGQMVSGVDVVLPRGSAVTGRIFDEFGQPVLRARVQVVRFQYQPDGQRRSVPVNTAMTDDLGQFRIWGLPPGEYGLSAVPREADGYAATFYPGTVDPAAAQPLVVGIGQEISAQLQLIAASMARVAGVVVDSAGTPRSGTALTLRSVVAGALPLTGQTNADGAFAIGNVAPGEYRLEVRPRVAFTASGTMARLSALESEFTSLPVAVHGDVTGLRVVTGHGDTLSGRVVYEGQVPAGLRLRMLAQPAEPGGSLAFPPAGRNNTDGVVGKDSRFEISGVTGPVLIRMQVERTDGSTQAQGTYALKAVLLDGADVTDTPFDPVQRGDAASLTVVVSDKMTDISGAVSDVHGAAPGTVVVIAPADLPPGVSAQRFVRVLPTAREGRFAVRGMPPGRYAAIAVSTFEIGRQYDPEVLARVRRMGRSFAIREGERLMLDLKVSADF